MKILLTLIALTVSMSAFAQGRGNVDGTERRGQGGGRVAQTLSIPESVVKANLPLDTAKFESLIADLKVLQGVNLPLEAVTEIKLTVDQKKSLVELAKGVQSKIREMQQAGDREGAMALRGSVAEKVKAILTADQIKVIERYPAPRFGGGQGSPGGGRGQGRPGGPPSSK